METDKNYGIVETNENHEIVENGIIDNTLTCDFCNCKFKVTKENIEIVQEFSSVGYYHKNIYKIISCPICNEIVRKRKFAEK